VGTIEVFFLILGLAIVCEAIDASIGMGYGTILSPLLIILGFSPLVVAPSILLSQALGGGIAAFKHHHYGNVSFLPKSINLKSGLLIGGLGLVAVTGSAFLAVSVPKYILKTYIGVVVLAMGGLLLANLRFSFSWLKMLTLSIVGAFNKGWFGGGFGPITTSGQIIVGQDHKNAIGVTTFAEVPICLAGFLTFLLINGTGLFSFPLIYAMCLGAMIGAPLGARVTKWIKLAHMRYFVGATVLVLGAWTLLKTWVF